MIIASKIPKSIAYTGESRKNVLQRISMAWDLLLSQLENRNSADLGKPVNKSMKYLHQKCHQVIWKNSMIIIIR